MAISIEDIIQKKIELPPMPLIIKRVMEIVSDPDGTTGMLSFAISRDPVITARILAISNSPFYWSPRKVDNLQSAIMVIGFDAIKNLVVAIATRDIYKKHGLIEQMMWEHSIGVAVSACLIANELDIKERDKLFTCGLLHDIGKVILLNTDKKDYEEIIRLSYNDDREFNDLEKEKYGFTHAEVGGLILKKWNLSRDFEEIIKFHHDVDRYRGDDEFVRKIIAIVNLADQICNFLGIGRRQPNEKIDIVNTKSFKMLKINEDEIENLMYKTKETFEKEKGLFS